MIANNFDQSSSGVNIELSVFFDTCRSQDDFSENFKHINDQTWLYIDNGNIDPDNYKQSKIVIICGYCQGDYAKIIVPTNLGYKRNFDFKSMFINLFYDAPIYATFSVNGNNEICYFDEYLADQYNYDKAEFIAIAEKQIDHFDKNIIMQFLSDNLPSTLDYI